MRAMDRYTAIVLSARPVTLEIPGVQVLASVQAITSVRQLYDVRLEVLGRVTTPFCFYLDDDDELPDDYLSVLDECAAHDVPLAYTDELVRYLGKEVRRTGMPYRLKDHQDNPMLVHHLALMRTRDAVQAAARLPRTMDFAVEQPLYMEIAKAGAAYVPRIGYIWNRTRSGISHWPQMMAAQVRALRWCNGGEA